MSVESTPTTALPAPEAEVLASARAGIDERLHTMQARVANAASQLYAEGLRPTVALVRIRLGGGSPNEIAPALKRWRSTFATTDPRNAASRSGAAFIGESTTPQVPDFVLELVQGLWKRALAAAGASGQAARAGSDASQAEASMLRTELASVRALLEREALANGALLSQAATSQAIARQALVRADEAEERELSLLHELGRRRAKRAARADAANAKASSKPAAPQPRLSSAKRPRPVSASKRSAVKKKAPSRFSHPSR